MYSVPQMSAYVRCIPSGMEGSYSIYYNIIIDPYFDVLFITQLGEISKRDNNWKMTSSYDKSILESDKLFILRD